MKKSNKKVMIVGGVLLLGVIVFSIYQVGGITQKKRDEKRRGSKTGSGNIERQMKGTVFPNGQGNEVGYGADTLMNNGQVLTAEDVEAIISNMADRNRTS